MKSVPLPAPDSQIFSILQEALPFLDVEHGPWMAGGSARKLAADTELGWSDIDIFFPNEEMFKWTCDFFNNFKDFSSGIMKFKVGAVDDTPASRLIQMFIDDKRFSLQLSKKKFYTSLEELFADFDFSICMFATDGNTILCGDESESDVQAKTLILNPAKMPTKPKAARLAKYVEQGFMPGPGVIRAMLGVDCPQFFAKADLTCDEY